MFDISKLELSELKQLSRDITNALDGYATNKRRECLKELKEVAKKHGFTLEDFTRPTAENAIKMAPVPKYHNPADPSQTWTGRGRKPAWIISGLDAGKQLADFAI
jgi:DNA-binding protein H-NS